MFTCIHIEDKHKNFKSQSPKNFGREELEDIGNVERVTHLRYNQIMGTSSIFTPKPSPHVANTYTSNLMPLIKR